MITGIITGICIAIWGLYVLVSLHQLHQQRRIMALWQARQAQAQAECAMWRQHGGQPTGMGLWVLPGTADRTLDPQAGKEQGQ